MTTRRTRPLDQFPAQYHRILETVRERGSTFFTFHSIKEANTVKMDLYRYRDSVLAEMPVSWEAEVCKGLMIRKKDASLEISLKSMWGAMRDIDEQLDEQEHGTTDEEAEALRKLEQDIQSGNY